MNNSPYEYIIYRSNRIEILKDIQNFNCLQQLFSKKNWDDISESAKLKLLRHLPKFRNDDQQEKEKTLKMLFEHVNFTHESPLRTFHDRLLRGFYHPKIGQTMKIQREIEFLRFHKWYHAYNCQLLKEIVIMRNLTLDHARRLIPTENEIYNAKTFIPQICPPVSFMLPIVRKYHSASRNARETPFSPDQINNNNNNNHQNDASANAKGLKDTMTRSLTNQLSWFNHRDIIEEVERRWLYVSRNVDKEVRLRVNNSTDSPLPKMNSNESDLKDLTK